MAYNSTSWATEAGTTSVSSPYSLYSSFNTNSDRSYNYAAGYHEILTFENSTYTSSGKNPHLGNGPDPATSYTTSDSYGYEADGLVNCLWYISDSIYIEEIYALVAADASEEDVVRMHLMSYDFNSGVSACLTNGVILASSSDVTSEGSEQPYLQSEWTIDNSSVSSGKVVVATFESVTILSDYSVNIKIKYKLM